MTKEEKEVHVVVRHLTGTYEGAGFIETIKESNLESYREKMKADEKHEIFKECSSVEEAQDVCSSLLLAGDNLKKIFQRIDQEPDTSLDEQERKKANIAIALAFK